VRDDLRQTLVQHPSDYTGTATHNFADRVLTAIQPYATEEEIDEYGRPRTSKSKPQEEREDTKARPRTTRWETAPVIG